MPKIKSIELFKGKYDFLSNFYPATVQISGVACATVEHAYQGSKTTDPVERERVVKCATPGAAKKAGSHVTLRKDWEFIKLSVMLGLIRQKFRISELRDKLLATGDAKLVEGNYWNDTFWGVCDGEGENWLGRILMHVRDEIRERRRFGLYPCW